jgi:hypothetical protein
MDELMETIAADIAAHGPAPLSTFPELGPFIYYIQCGQFLKIGTSIDPEKRCDQLRRGGKALRPSVWAGDPQLITYLPGNVFKERSLHHQFASKRDRGEWFVLDQELTEHVAFAKEQQRHLEAEIHQRRYQQFTGRKLSA